MPTLASVKKIGGKKKKEIDDIHGPFNSMKHLNKRTAMITVRFSQWQVKMPAVKKRQILVKKTDAGDSV